MPENSLHAAIKDHLLLPGDRFEGKIDGYIIDIIREAYLVEIQTKNFYALKPKLSSLLDNHQVNIVHPIAKQKWIIRVNGDGKVLSRRKSPKRGTLYDVFNQLIYIPQFLNHPNLSISVLMIDQEDILCDNGKGSWRRKGWGLVDQRLRKVHEIFDFHSLEDLVTLVDRNLPASFSNAELAGSLGCPVQLARKITYTLHHADYLVRAGKKGRAILYSHPQAVSNG